MVNVTLVPNFLYEETAVYILLVLTNLTTPISGRPISLISHICKDKETIAVSGEKKGYLVSLILHQNIQIQFIF